MVEIGTARLRELLDRVPHFGGFRYVDELERESRELAKHYPEAVEWRTIGQSSEGRPITALVIGEGDQSVFLYAFTHPNEPIGSLTVEYLASRLAASPDLRRQLGYKFILAKAIDVDGAKLNEGWFHGPFNPLTYAENYYRPPPNEQAEWTFPIDYKTLHWSAPNSETRAIKKVVDEFKPEFTYILHNADFCGVYYYLSHELQSAYAELKAVPGSYGLPLHKGEPPDELYLKSLDEGIYHDYGVTDEYEFLSKTLGSDPATRINYGTDCYEYVRNTYDGFCLTCELPYFYDERITDSTPTRSRRRELLLESLKIEADTRGLMKHILAECGDQLNAGSRIYRAIHYLVESWSDVEQTTRTHSEDKEFDRPATVAEEFDLTVLKRFSQMPKLGMMERLLREAEAARWHQKLSRLHEKVHSRLLRLNADITHKSNPRVIPIQTLVKIQLESAIVCLRHLESSLLRT